MQRINEIFSKPNLSASISNTSTTVRTSAAVFAAIVTAYLYNDYRTYISMGPGGIPHNALGWLIASLLKPLSLGANVLSIAPYEGASEPSYLEDPLPRRNGKRPTIGKHPVPHRQLDQLPSDDAKGKLVSKIREVYDTARTKGAVDVKMSFLERHTDAIFFTGNTEFDVAESARQAARDTGGEFAHVHTTGDHSLHVILSPADCKKVMEAGWGERHSFDGSAMVRRLLNVKLPMTYLMIYAPRNDKEIEIALSILNASIRYMTGWDVDAR